MDTRSNRTFMELKFEHFDELMEENERSNRTFMELKSHKGNQTAYNVKF